MAKGRPFVVDESFLGTTPWHDRRAADALAAAIRKPLEALESAAREAEKGMLGPAKLGLLVATTHLIDALEAVDDEFARRSAARPAPSSTPQPTPHEADARDA
jgi:hypothetical protein